MSGFARSNRPLPPTRPTSPLRNARPTSLKSSAAYLGAEALRRHVAEMEMDARAGRIDALPAKLVEARRLLERILPALAEEIRRRK